MTADQIAAPSLPDVERRAGEESRHTPSPATLDRAAWLARRRAGIGASDVAGVLGLSPWASPWSVWADKVGLTPLDDDPSEAMEFGVYAEKAIVPWFEARTGLTVAGEQTGCTHPEHSWMCCTVDGFVVDGGDTSIADALGALEIKTTSDAPEAWAVQVPDHYACQATWTMAVTGLERVWFAVLHLAFGRVRFRVYEFGRDRSDIDYVMQRCSAFWRANVLAGVPPATDGHPATTGALKVAWPDAVRVEVVLDDDVLAYVAHYESLKAEAKRVKDDTAEAENVIRAALGDRTEGVDLDGRLVCSWRPQDTTRVDPEAVRADHGDKYDTKTTSRVLRLHKPKGKK